MILSQEKEKYENMRKNNKKEEEIKYTTEEKNDIEDDEELYAMNLENYIQNNQGKQIINENLDVAKPNKYNMKTMNKPEEKYFQGYLQPYCEVEQNNYGVYKSLLN